MYADTDGFSKDIVRTTFVPLDDIAIVPGTLVVYTIGLAGYAATVYVQND